ncbi:unnamed protein product, partial [Adineta steineri]
MGYGWGTNFFKMG